MSNNKVNLEFDQYAELLLCQYPYFDKVDYPPANYVSTRLIDDVIRNCKNEGTSYINLNELQNIVNALVNNLRTRHLFLSTKLNEIKKNSSIYRVQNREDKIDKLKKFLFDNAKDNSLFYKSIEGKCIPSRKDNYINKPRCSNLIPSLKELATYLEVSNKTISKWHKDNIVQVNFGSYFIDYWGNPIYIPGKKRVKYISVPDLINTLENQCI